MMKVVVLISGRGTNLEALLNHQKGYTITHVVSNKQTAKGLKVAQKHGVHNTFIDWQNQQQAESMLCQLLKDCQPDLIVLAGFMRILSARVVNHFKDQIINIHPSLLPKYPGLNTHHKVLKNKDKIHGATVHLVDNKLDHGKILAQTEIAVNPDWSESQLATALLTKEHELLTRVVGQMATQRNNKPTATADHSQAGNHL